MNQIETISYKNLFLIILIHALAASGFWWMNSKMILIWLLAHFFWGVMGASISLHRYFSHRSFRAGPIIEHFLALFGTLCFQGSIHYWASVHRQHHQFSDKYGDPHSSQRGFFWSHMGWLFYTNPNGYNYIKSIRNIYDIRKNKSLDLYEKYYFSINIIFLTILFLVCFSLNHEGVFFAIGPIRIVSVWHSTWLVNSYCHGATIFPSIKCKNLIDSHFVSFLIGGDGYHRSHHNQPFSAVPGHDIFRFDFSYKILRLFKKVKLISY